MTSILDFPVSPEAHFAGPTLLLKGSKSTFVRSSHFKEVEKYFPNYFLVSVKEAGHWLHFDQPEETADRVSHFLKSVRQFYASR